MGAPDGETGRLSGRLVGHAIAARILVFTLYGVSLGPAKFGRTGGWRPLRRVSRGIAGLVRLDLPRLDRIYDGAVDDYVARVNFGLLVFGGAGAIG